MGGLAELSFGVSIAPSTELAHVRDAVLSAENAGLDLVGVQDHPYVGNYVDSFALIADLAARTERIHFFPDVANLPLRPAPMLARAVSSLSLLSGGRFQLGLGAGGYWDAITSLGVARRTAAEALDAQEEAITLLRRLWQRHDTITFDGDHYSVKHLAGQEPHPNGVEIWVGAQGPRSLKMTGRLADGWAAPIPAYLPYEEWAESNRIVDRSAEDAGRDPRRIRRIAQVVGTVSSAVPGSSVELSGAQPIRTDVTGWVDVLTRLSERERFTSFVLWPENDDRDHIRRFGEEVVPAVRQRLAG